MHTSKTLTPSLLRPSEVADRLGVHRTTIWRWVKSGDFPAPIKLGDRATGFRDDQVRAWVDHRSADANDQDN